MRDDDFNTDIGIVNLHPLKEVIGFVILVDIILIVTDVLLQKTLKII